MADLKVDWQHEQTRYGQIEKLTLQNGDHFGADISGPHTFKSMDEASAFISGARAAVKLLE